MTNHRKVIKIFIASPGGLDDERRAAKEVVDEINLTSSDFLGVHLQIVGWEETLARFGRPQEQINNDLRQCEYFIGVLWDHFGQHKPDVDGNFESGFHEEFELAKALREQGKQMEMTQLFKNVEERHLNDPGEKLQRVLAFRQEIQDSHMLLHKSFEGVEEFKTVVRRLLVAYAQENSPIIEHRQEMEDVTEGRKSTAVPNETDQPEAAAKPIFSPLQQEFLAPLVEREGDYESLHPHEVARFRLVASSVKRSGNDDAQLGPHDANILYRKRHELLLSDAEYRALIDTGLAHMPGANVPLWYWLQAADRTIKQQLSLSSIGGEGGAQYAIFGLRVSGNQVDDMNEYLTTDLIINSWFNKDSKDQSKIEALKYFAMFGTSEDISRIESWSEQLTSENLARAATETKIILAGKNGGEAGFNCLVELDPSNLSKSSLDMIAGWLLGISANELKRGLSAAYGGVRYLCAEALVATKALQKSDAEILLTDANAKTRRLALDALIGFGTDFSIDEAKKILVRPKKTSTGFGLLTNRTVDNDDEGEAEFASYIMEHYGHLTDEELLTEIDKDWLFELNAQTAYWAKHYKANQGLLVESVMDGFSTFYDNHRESHVTKEPALEPLFVRIEKNKKIILTTASQKTFELICTKADATQLPFVRSIIDTTKIGFSVEAATYLSKYGDWSDIERVLALYQRRITYGRTLLSIRSDWGDTKAAAATIAKLAGQRAGEALLLEMDTALFKVLVVEISQAAFQNLSDEQLEQLFAHKDDVRRKVLALRAVSCYSKTRLTKLLERQCQRDQYFYNVVHWLDFGVVLPRAVAKRGAQLALSEL